MSAPVTSALSLAELRPAAAAVLAPQAEDDPPVLVDVVDALYPPALMLVWSDPWLEAGAGRPSFGPCLLTAHLQVLCIGSRVEPGPGIEQLERLAEYVLERFAGDPYTWPFRSISGPRVFDIGGTSYLGARVNYAVPIAI